MSMLRVYLFDHLALEKGSHDLAAFFPPRLQELLAYLFLYGSQPQAREVLASLFWGESSTTQSRKNLRQALWQIHTISNSHSISPGRRLFLVDADQVRLNPEADLWLDVAEFERACVSAHGRAGSSLDAPQARSLHRAADLYRGDLLQGWYQDWCLYERERFQNLYLAILDKLMDYYEGNGDYEAGLACGANSLRYDGARERTHRRLMRLYALAGNRTAALRQFARCRNAVLRELAVEPSASTVALYRRIEAETPPGVMSDPDAADRGSGESTAGNEELLESIKSVQRTLSDIQALLERLVEREPPAAPQVARTVTRHQHGGSSNSPDGRRDGRHS